MLAEGGAADAVFELRQHATQLSIEHEPPSVAAQRLQQLQRQYPEPDYQLRLAILSQRILLRQNRPQQALTNIENLQQRFSAEDNLLIEALKADALQRAGLIIESVRLRVELDRAYPRADAARTLNNQKLWQSLMALPVEMIGDNITATPDTFSGWLELAYLSKQYRHDGARFKSALDGWISRNTEHPANHSVVDTLRRQQISVDDIGVSVHPRHIALLLPLSGPLQSVGQAIRDGFVAAYMQDKPEMEVQPRVDIYDTGGKPEFGVLAAQRANERAADIIVGPLDKSVVHAVVTAAITEQPAEFGQALARKAPVLALNNVPPQALQPNADPRVYEFTLAPESEAVQAAERAGRDGRRYAMMIIPDNAWGDRIYQAFAARYLELGGTIISEHRFQRDEPRHAQGIQRGINLDRSKSRHQYLKQTLRREIEFNPRPRRDMDMVFLAGSAAEARQIRPQLRFFNAGHVPVYATSHIYTGTPSPQQDKDLDGVYFADMPWVLDDKPPPGSLARIIYDHWPETAGQARFHALGADIFRLLPWLQWMTEHTEYSLNGGTGRLSLSPNGLIHRRAEWAVFSNGAPVAAPVDDRGGDGRADDRGGAGQDVN